MNNRIIKYKTIALILCVVPILGCIACREETGADTPKYETFNITFVQEGQADIVKKVKIGETLTDIPVPINKQGYYIEWSITTFDNITSDLTVYAVETAKTYTVQYDLGVVSNDGYATIDSYAQTVKYDQSYTLEIPACYGYDFTGWVLINTDTVVTDGVWLIDSNVILTALWKLNVNSDRWWTGEF